MAEEKQPPGVVEGATTGDVEDEMLDDKAKSAEDRKAAAALSKLDARDDDVAGSASVDQEGLSKAMNKLSVAKSADKTALNKVKVDAGDVALLVRSKAPMSCVAGTEHCERSFEAQDFKADDYVVAQVDELDLTKPKATELLKQHEGDAVKAMTAYVQVA
ncbi:hypothetical protein N0V82_004540 [Gnomoniopsis sp. IMI 355080]|nr:hypothetical protein N0V82_004540 [Gnomoniopsis sp. IMI 355080]